MVLVTLRLRMPRARAVESEKTAMTASFQCFRRIIFRSMARVVPMRDEGFQRRFRCSRTGAEFTGVTYADRNRFSESGVT
jgi:hypothetical protein